MIAVADQAAELDEAARVTQWRFDVLRLVGVDAAVAWDLAASDADLHDVVRAHDAGCSDRLLREIFA